ncbi:MlaD family protein [Conexibacter sp. SYSU D00693]|uniref:MlaD family protein n=1 Tax=Conexibacter sp. SYSU D00693 TaxID=2812560 RepID=UPI00196A7287|nr:MlaD family protein [Conexibacter sp. SYSU D00693]
MIRRPNESSIAANPVLIGAATVLVTLVAMFLSYNANDGLPFVPTYEVEVLVPDAASLVPGNDVRVGGERVGVVDAITAEEQRDGTVAARLALKLEEPQRPLPTDSVVTVRPRSTLGLKYLELQRGRSRRGVRAGGTLPVSQAGGIVELDEVFNAFDAESRRAFRGAVEPAADALASRGQDVSASIEALRPATRLLRPVARTLRARRTDLRGWIRGLEAAAGAAAPVAAQLGSLTEGAAATLGSLDAERDALGATLDRAPQTEAVATRVLGRARPVVADAAALARELRPGTRALPAAARSLDRAVRRGTPVLRRAIPLGPDLERTLRALQRLSQDPATPDSVTGLTAAVASLEPTLRRTNPFQVTCNYLGLWTRNASSTISEGDETGNWFSFTPVLELPEVLQSATPSPRLHATPYGSVDGECETGNERWTGQQRIGSTPEREPFSTELTAPPKGTPPGPGMEGGPR